MQEDRAYIGCIKILFLDCSRFWECGPNYETCLFECANCQHAENENPQCAGQWALTFDVRYQYPVGPVCDWPSAIDCTLTCPETAQCQENSDCNDCDGGYCNVDCTCTYPNPCSCSSDQDCDNFDGLCDLPSPHHPEYCAYCDAGVCKGGKGRVPHLSLHLVLRLYRLRQLS